MELTFEVIDKPRYVACKSFSSDNKQVSKCKIDIDNIDGVSKWTISEFYTSKEFMHMGFGKVTMKHLVHYLICVFGIPSEVEYIWNGANEYVLEWITRNFDAVCTCPIAVQKLMVGDKWEAHVYGLNKNKFMKYFYS